MENYIQQKDTDCKCQLPWLVKYVWSFADFGYLPEDALVLTKELREEFKACQLHWSFSKSHEPSSVPHVPLEMIMSSTAGSLFVPDVALDTNTSWRKIAICVSVTKVYNVYYEDNTNLYSKKKCFLLSL